MKIRRQMILVLIAVALLPLGIVGVLTYRISRQRLAAQADQTLLILSRRVATDVDDFVFRNLESVRTDSLIPTIIDFVSSPPDNKRARRQSQITELLQAAT